MAHPNSTTNQLTRWKSTDKDKAVDRLHQHGCLSHHGYLTACRNKGMVFSTTLLHHRHNDAFVNDVTGYANAFITKLEGNNVQTEVLHKMQQDATLWNKLLTISGGKLALIGW